MSLCTALCIEEVSVKRKKLLFSDTLTHLPDVALQDVFLFPTWRNNLRWPDSEGYGGYSDQYWKMTSGSALTFVEVLDLMCSGRKEYCE
jgi:hypothetical protein